MTTAASSLIEQVRGVVRDWGSTNTTLAAAISSTSATSATLTNVEDVSKGQFLLVDNEMLEVTEVYPGDPGTVTIVRGARGSTAATHSSGALVRIEPVWSNNEILRALNQALDSAFPAIYTLIDDTNTDVSAGTAEYTIPATCDQLARVELETSTSGIYEITRQWSYQDADTIIIPNHRYFDNRTIRFIGYGKFSASTISGNLDSDYPDSDANAVEYLVVKASANLLGRRQAPLARRDSFVGITDSFQQSQPLMSMVTANDLNKQAKSLLAQARMKRLQEFLPDPGRVYYSRA